MPRKDVELIKATATGQWKAILIALGGVPGDILDGRHHPCPKCKGTDRFRWDPEKEFAICNQCFKTKNGDGFAALQWLTGWKFTEAKKRVAEFLGVQPVKGSADPAKDLVFKEWSPQLAIYFLASKPGITEEAILATGGRLASYKKSYTVIAWPIIGETLDPEKPVGWVLANVLGGTLPKFSPKGEIVGQTKFKVAYGSKPGLIGLHAIERLKTPGLVDVVWKVEGISDMLSLYSAMPDGARDRQVVVTNAMGTNERPRWMAGLLARYNAHVCHDADRPGQAGATTWVAEIAAQGGSVRHVCLPYEVAEDHGKDLRDWLADGHDWTDLQLLVEKTPPFQIAKTDAGDVDTSKITFPVQELILKKLEIEILYEDESGRVRVFSMHLRKSSWIPSVERLKIETLIQICGPPAMMHISSDPDGEETWSLSDVKKSIALIASRRRGNDDERGVGIWQSQDDDGNVSDSIVLVGNTEAARWNGDGCLYRVAVPHVDGLTLDFGAGGKDWYRYDTLNRHLQSSADASWRRDVLDQSKKIFEKWNWQHQDIDPSLVTGLILATWVQTVWDWRPLVSVTGESNCGKSILFEALGGAPGRRGLFGALSFRQSKSTEAGVRQGIGNTARVALCDEFEKSGDREKILEMLRASTRGEAIARGTSDQKGRQTILRHLGWVAATETGLQRQPDLNRFIQLSLLPAERGKFGLLKLPEGSSLQDLGQKLLAVAVWSAIKAKRLAAQMKAHQIPGIDARTIESYGVPAAILSVAIGYTDKQAIQLLEDLVANVDPTDQGQTDHNDLLEAIMTSVINTGPHDGILTVGQLIESESLYMTHASKLEAAGIRWLDEGSIFFACNQVGRQLLRGTPWERQRIKQLLIRIKGAKHAIKRIGSSNLRGITIPFVRYASEDDFT